MRAHALLIQEYGDLDTLRQMIETGQVTPVVGQTYTLADVPEAVHHLQDGHARGKIAITI